ncbi:MAG: glycosyltransferase 87 family protein [Pseudomonadota bacterium]
MADFFRSDSLAARSLYAVMLASALFVLARGIWPDPDYYPVDFKYFWLSGALWLEGVSPYGPELETLGAEQFPGVRINPFFYPPNWRAVSSLAALTGPQAAAVIWATLSACALLAASWQLALLSSASQQSLSIRRAFVLIAFFLIVIAHSGAVAITIGQPAPMLLCAVTTLLISMRYKNTQVAAVALTVLFLKPQLSIPLAITAFLFLPWMRRSVVIAGGATGALAFFGLGWSAPADVLAQFLSNIRQYGHYPENWPIHMSGPDLFLALANAQALSPFFWLVVSVGCAIGLASLAARASIDFSEPDNELILMLAALMITLFMMPTHNTDIMLAAPAILLLGQLPAYARLALIVGFALIMRSLSLSVMSDGFIFAEKTVWVALYDTMGLLCLCIAALISFQRILHAKNMAGAADTAPTLESDLADCRS